MELVPIGHIVKSECDLKTRVRNRGPRTTFFDDFAN